MKRIFIASETPILALGDVSNLTAGKLGVFGMNKTTMVFERYNPSNTYDFIQFYLGGSELPSNRIDMKPRRSRIIKAPYKAPVKPVDNYVVSVMFGTSAYDEFTVVISPVSTEPTEFVAEAFSVTGIFANAAAVYNALSAKINASSKWATSSVSGGGLAITTIGFDYNIETSLKFTKDETNKCGDPCVVPTIVKTSPVDFNLGNGTPEHVARLDYIARPEKGNMASYIDADMPFPKTFDATLGGTFDMYFWNYSNEEDATGADTNKQAFEMKHELVIAVPAGGALATELDAFLDALPIDNLIVSPLV